MASVEVHTEVELDDPLLVEGLPGIGLVGKIAADHLIETLDMTPHASVHCDGIPRVAVYGADDGAVRAPVRIYADEESDLLVLQSDVPVSPSGSQDFAACVTGWMAERDVTPIFQSGRPTDNNTDPSLVGISTGEGAALLDDADIDRPSEDGAVQGPTGAMVYEAGRSGLDGVGLVVDADPQFPDPAAARVLLVDGVIPLTGVDVETEQLVEQAEQIATAKADLAQQMQQGGEDSTQAKPLGMYQ